jgi:5-(carboxyamino)imidazole ribonucleotide synthase
VTGPRVGVVGGGQLGRMLAEAGGPLGMSFTFLEPAEAPCAGAVGTVIRGAYDDRDALAALAAASDVVTWEFENVPVDAARFLAERVPVYPPPEALEAAQDRVTEKRTFRSVGVETAAFVAVDTPQDVLRAIDVLGLPAILKTRRMGYDGKGQLFLAEPEQVHGAFATLGSVPCILEQVVPFDRELSILAVRGRGGELRTYPLVENRHAGGILRWSTAPAPNVQPPLQQRADALARTVADALGYVGVLAIELFQVGDHLLANEMAPRVHNSGHFTIEGAATSQFENHLRAVVGWPLGDTAVRLPSACVNLLGRAPEVPELLAVEGARVHLYGKAPKPGRKVGHVTLSGPDEAAVRTRLEQVRALLDGRRTP